MWKLPNKLQKLNSNVESLINLLKQQKNSTSQRIILFNQFPNIDNKCWEIKKHLLRDAHSLQVPNSPYSSKSWKYRNKLLEFLSGFKSYYNLYLNQSIPDWALYKPYKHQNALEFFQKFFNSIDQNYSQNWKNDFDRKTRFSIPKAKQTFKNWKKSTVTPDWEKYMNKVKSMNGLIWFIKGCLKFIGTPKFKIRLYLKND